MGDKGLAIAGPKPKRGGEMESTWRVGLKLQ